MYEKDIKQLCYTYVISFFKCLHYFVGTNSSDHQVNVVALSKVIISDISTFGLSFFFVVGFLLPGILDWWHFQMCVTISSLLFSSIAADLLHIAQSIWTFVTTKNNLECGGDTWTFFTGTNFAFRTTRGKCKAVSLMFLFCYYVCIVWSLYLNYYLHILWA